MAQRRNGNFGSYDDDDGYSGSFGAPSSNQSNYSNGGNNYSSGNYNEPKTVQTQIEDSRVKTIESQQRALRSLYESEKIGVSTATELIEQGEKLRKTETKLDEIGEMQKTTQRQINSLSSVFGGIKNWFTPKANPPKAGGEESIISSSSAPIQNPASTVRLRETMEQQSKAQMQSSSRSYEEQQFSSSSQQPYQKKFDSNLDEMGQALGRLKGLAIGMEGELRTQNDDLDRMGTKMEKVQTTMRVQDRQLNTILYGKK